MTLNNLNEILEFAMAREQQAHDFYMMLASTVDQEEMKGTFVRFAKEELGHKRKLEQIRAGSSRLPMLAKETFVSISRYALPAPPDQEMDYTQSLILAMNREKTSFRLYADLAEACEDIMLKQTFMALAQEEARHKVHFELEYDRMVATSSP